MTPAFLQRATRKVNEIGKVKNPTRKYGAWGTRLIAGADERIVRTDLLSA